MQVRDIIFSALIGQHIGRTNDGQSVIVPKPAVEAIQAAGEWIE